MSSNKSPGNQRREDGSKQGNEQNSEKQGSTPLADVSGQQQGGQGAQQEQDAGRQRGDRNGSDSGGGKS